MYSAIAHVAPQHTEIGIRPHRISRKMHIKWKIQQRGWREGGREGEGKGERERERGKGESETERGKEREGKGEREREKGEGSGRGREREG